jgi:hypothetical protein
MTSIRRLDIHIPVAVPEADRDVHPRLLWLYITRADPRNG